MDLGRVVERVAEPGSAQGQHHEAQSRDAAAFRTLEGARPSSTMVSNYAPPAQSTSSSPDVWKGAITRLQAQVSLNTSMLESNRRQIGDIEQAVGRLQQELGTVVAVIHEVRAEVHARPLPSQPNRHDSGDLDVLASQVATIGSKANEIDGLKMQLDLIRNRMRRLEETGSPTSQRPDTGSMTSIHREHFEVTPAPAHHAQHHHAPQLPPMRTAPVMSPPGQRPHGMLMPAVLPSQPLAAPVLTQELRPHATEHSAMQHAPTPSYRYAEPLPPPSALSGWRPAESQTTTSAQHPAQATTAFRPSAAEPEAPISGWATINQPVKRPLEEQHKSPYEQSASAPGSPKRPRLAPIMPRGTYGDEGYAPSQGSVFKQPTTTATPDASLQTRSRATSDVTHMLPTPSSANAGPYRFVTSTTEADSQAPWRSQSQRPQEPPQAQHSTSGGRGRGRSGRGRGGRGRSGKNGAPIVLESQELGAPEWERDGWTGSQVLPNGYYNPTQPGHGDQVIAPPDHPEADYPATPAQGQQDPFAPQPEVVLSTSSSKKSRTKPIRNSEGILIRKDGRPDMRSVSSANNLRKVHAKKEAERAEQEGRTPTSARSQHPLHSSSLSEDDHDARSGTPGSHGDEEGDEQDTQERHRELMSRIFPQGIVEGAGGRGLAGAYFPPRAEHPYGPEMAMKTEEPEEMHEQRRAPVDSHMTDAPPETSDAKTNEHRAAEQREGGKMEAIEEEAGEHREEAQAQQHWTAEQPGPHET